MSLSPLTRRTFLLQLGATLGGTTLALTGGGCSSIPRDPGNLRMFIGTYTGGISRGIYSAQFDPAAGRINLGAATEGIENPSFLTLNARGTHLYAVSEVGEFAGVDGGGVVAYELVDGGALRELNRQPTHGGAPCHLALDPSGRFLIVANYSGGNAAVFPVQTDGSLEPASHVVQHEGSGPNAERQKGPHAHQVAFAPDGAFVFVVDLGIDRVVGYRLDADTGHLLEVPAAGMRAAPGAGPRHLAFHPDGERVYIINELNSTLTAANYDAESGRMEVTGTLSTLPEDYSGDNSCADVHVHPGGRFVYGSNRGHDSIVVFEIEPNGDLMPIQHQSSGGRTPRNFTIDPGGRHLVVANQDTDSLVILEIDPTSGRLAPVGDPIEVPSPVCIRWNRPLH